MKDKNNGVTGRFGQKQPCMKLVWFLIVSMFAIQSSYSQDSAVVVNAQYKLASASVNYVSTCYDSSSRIIFINVHENEITAIQAARDVLHTTKKHCLVELQSKKLRLVTFSTKGKKYSIDPNRIYTERGARASLKKLNKTYSHAVLNKLNHMARNYTTMYIDNKRLVVALHNNTDRGFSIANYLQNSDKARDAAEVYIDPKQDPDDFFFTTERNYFEFLKSKGFNAVLQHNHRATDDGSLSIYCARNKIPYINIEVQTGHLSQQTDMLRVVHDLINSELVSFSMQ